MKKTYKIIGLDCANCAKEVERHLAKNKEFKKVSIDFINNLIYLEGSNLVEDSNFIEEEIAKVEDGISLKEVDKGKVHESVMNKESWILLIRVLISGIIVTLTRVFQSQMSNVLFIILYMLAYVIVSYDIIIKVFINLFKKHKFFDENMLMFIATVGAIALGEYFEAVLVMLLNQVGEMLQHISIMKSKKAIVSTIDLRADIANLLVGEDIKQVSPEELKIGDIVLLKAGDSVPSDGEVIEGEGSLDTSSLTGEALPMNVGVSSKILSGTKVFEGTLKMKVSKVAYESTASKVMELVTSSSQNKSKAEHFITKFAAFYTPIIFAVALIIGIVPPIFNGQWANFLNRALSFLVISCPCAIIISIPLAYFVSMGMAAKNGVIIKGGNYLDLLNEIDQAIFDKTGTITKGNFSVSEVKPINIKEEDFKDYYYLLESSSNHPIAKAISEAFKSKNKHDVESIKEVAGHGMEGKIDGNDIILGNESSMKEVKGFERVKTSKTVVYMAKNNVFAGYVIVSDEIKPSSSSFISFLAKQKIKSVMLTGDRKENAKEVCAELNINDYHAECLPGDKLVLLEQDMKKAKKTMYIGDGINDAPSIARADIGVAMGIKGADIAVENADVIIMNDDLTSVEKALKIAKLTRRQAIFNIVFALTIKLAVLIIASFDINLGISNMIIAVIADVGLSLFLVLITMLMGRRKIK